MENDDNLKVITDENRSKWIIGIIATVLFAVGFSLLLYFLDLGKMPTLQIVNIVTYIVCLAANGAAQKIMPYSLRAMSDQWKLELQLSNAAFAIWGIIYTLLLVFVVYQALPAAWVNGRNDELIFTKIGWLLPINFLLNASWLLVFMTNCRAGMVGGLIIIVAMLVTAEMMMYQQSYYHLTVTEIISLRCGISIYAGWLNAATVLNLMHMLKSFGTFGENGVKEVRTSTIILWITLCIYVATTVTCRNPLFGAVLVFVLNALRLKTENSEIKMNAYIIMAIMSAFLIGITIWLAVEAANKTAGNFGLFY